MTDQLNSNGRNLENDRTLFKLIADPIKVYLTRQGLDPVINLALISGIASEVFDNLVNHIEVKPKPPNPLKESNKEHRE